MKKCFVVSLHRSGTKSVSALLRALGVTTIHFPNKHNGRNLQAAVRGREHDLPFVFETIRPLLDEYDAASDVPIPVLYRELDAAYPGSRFFLLRRNPLDWARSARNHSSGRDFQPFARIQYWHYLKGRPARIEQITDADLVGMYEKHLDAMSSYFGPRLGVFELLDPECGSKVAAHLGIESTMRLPPEKKKSPGKPNPERGSKAGAIRRSKGTTRKHNPPKSKKRPSRISRLWRWFAGT
jgi:hypothetical protein